MKDKKIVYKGNIFAVTTEIHKINDKDITFEFAERAPGVRLIIEKDEKVLLSREYRAEIKDYDYRLAGGKVFDKLDLYLDYIGKNEDIESMAKKAAIKEASEELGILVNDCKLSHVSICGATVKWDLYYYVVTNFDELEKQNLEIGEDITKVWVNKNDAIKMSLNGSISEERSAIALLRYLK